MNQLLALLKLEKLKGSRTKLALLVYALLLVLEQFGVIGLQTISAIEPYLGAAGALFAIEHFEKKA